MGSHHPDHEHPAKSIHRHHRHGTDGRRVDEDDRRQMRGWDVDAETLCERVLMADDVFGPLRHVVFLCLPNSDVVQPRAAGAPNCACRSDHHRHQHRRSGEMAALGAELAAQGVHYLDATVSGSSAQLLQRDVLVMVGGDAAVFERVVICS
jgi:hypothetical protein